MFTKSICQATCFGMTWNELTILISESCGQFPEPLLLALPVPEDKPLRPNTFLQQEKQTREAVDATVRRFSRDRVWPETTPIEGYFLAQRLHFVGPFVKILALSKKGEKACMFPNTPPEIADETQIEWLLNDAWAAVGFFEWERRLNAELARELSE